MNLIFRPDAAWLEVLLRLVALAQLAVAVLNFFLWRMMGWRRDLAEMDLLVRQVVVIHGWFISLTLLIWAGLTWRFCREMACAPTELSRWLCAAIALFWGVRCAMQWLHYDRSHWRGNAVRTAIHWLLFAVYGGWSAVYALAATG